VLRFFLLATTAVVCGCTQQLDAPNTISIEVVYRAEYQSALTLNGADSWSLLVTNDTGIEYGGCLFAVNSQEGGFVALPARTVASGVAVQVSREAFANTGGNSPAVVEDVLLQCSSPGLVEVTRF
jgi:hypothetical protein